MSFDDRHPVTHHRDVERRGFEGSVHETPEHLGRLLLDLLFFILDEGDHVAKNVEAGDARVTRTADRLHRGHEHAFDAERLLEGCEAHHQNRGCAVGITGDRPFPSARFSLSLDEADVVGVRLRNEQRDVRSHAERRSVREHERSRRREERLDLGRRARIKRAEDDGGEGFGWMRRTKCRFGQAPVGFAIKTPRARVLKSLARASIGGREMPDLEKRVVFQPAHETLADDAGGAEDGDRNATHRGCFFLR